MSASNSLIDSKESQYSPTLVKRCRLVFGIHGFSFNVNKSSSAQKTKIRVLVSLNLYKR